MWPRAEAHGNLTNGRVLVCHRGCFNVAAGRSPRKSVQRHHQAPSRRASMWPRAEAHRNDPLDDVAGVEVHASMWPRAEAHGNNRSYAHLPGCLGASMWPRAEAHGNLEVEVKNAKHLAASMWPRAEAHGNSIFGFYGVGRCLLQCGRGPKPTEIETELSLDDTSIKRFNVAAGRSPRKFAPWLSACCHVYSFNVAAGRSPRKWCTSMRCRVRTWASMWPRAEAHGNGPDAVASHLGAPLQCGRGPKPTEIHYGAIASSVTFCFNVAAGRSPRKFKPPNWRCTIPRCFNVAAGRSPRKYTSSGDHYACVAASMWPRAEAHGNAADADHPRGFSAASMWPRAEAHGNIDSAVFLTSGAIASMWPRAEAHGNPCKRCEFPNYPAGFNVAAGRSPRKSPTRNNFIDFALALQCGRGPKPTEIAHHADDPTMYEPSTQSRPQNGAIWKFAEFYISVKCILSCHTPRGAKIPNCTLNRRGSDPS